MVQRTIRVCAIDNHPLLLAGIECALKKYSDFDVVGTGQTKADAITLALTHKPEAMLLDIAITGGGIEAVIQISQHLPSTKLIILTASDRPDHVNAALAAGVSGYILKGTGCRELCDSIRTVCDGKRYITPELAMAILSPHAQSHPHASDPSAAASIKNAGPTLSKRDFTSRELDVIELLSAGKSNKTIAEALFLSEKTVKNHMSNIMDKLQVHSRLSAALIISKWKTSESE
ncbi:MAG: LuxR C-terminal-related transcriptional regulator [Notoacmeibacter sp.]